LIISPIIIFLAVCGLLFYINKILLVLAVILFIILFIIYVIILTLRLFFSLPSMFLDYPGPIKAIQNSWNLSKGRFKQVFIIYGVVIGLTFFFNTFIGQPMQSSFVEFVFGLSIIKVIVGFVLLVLFLILESFVFTFEHLFIFLSYIDFKGLDSIVKK